MNKLYVVTYKSTFDIEDCIFTTHWDRAIELLNKKPNQKQIVEYTFDSNGVSDFWTALHFYKNGILVSEKTLK
jgi:hypothetical protein